MPMPISAPLRHSERQSDSIASPAILDSAHPPAGSVRCAAGIACNTIEDNRTEDSAGSATAGAAILMQDKGAFEAARLSIRGNSGGHAVRAFDSGFALDTVAFVGNAASATLIRIEDGGALDIVDSTLAGNAISATEVLSVNGDFSMLRSILWQPGKISLTQSAGAVSIVQVIASETASLGAGALALSPRLVDPDRGDVRLRAASPAIDLAPAITGNDVDVDSLPRDRRLQPVPRNDGFVRDIGAHERQSIAPLVLNSDFDADLNLWRSVTPGISSWDATQNVIGAGGSGSVKVTQPGTANLQRISGLTQCVHLPGPGTYALNGWARSGAGGVGNRDYMYLNWEYRAAGGEDCTNGAATSAGDHFLSNSPSWQHPANPKLIIVPVAEWTSTSSIAVSLVAVEFGTTSPSNTIGWFDGITLEWIDPNDRIFDDGFEPPL